jgi:hypothetical protein
MDKKLKVAICLTGLLGNRCEVSAYIKQIFTKIGNDNNIDFDYYCHFWNNDKPYPYEINDEWLGVVSLPKENDASVKGVIATLNPKAITYNSYNDMFSIFLNHGLTQSIDYSRYLDFFINKKIDKNFFISLDEINPTTYFDAWWEFHSDWINFAHLTSQFFALEECLKTIVNSGTKYDAVLRWRYDQLFLTTEYHVSKLVDNLRLTHRNHIAFEWMRRGEWGSSEVNYITDYKSQVQQNKSVLGVSMSDSWWIVDHDTAAFISKYLTIAYADIRKYHSVFWIRGAGQHAFFYHALLSMNINFLILGSIGSNIIRDSTVLPPVDNLDDLSVLDSELALTIAAQHGRKSALAKQLDELQNKKHFYDVIKHFNFASKETL